MTDCGAWNGLQGFYMYPKDLYTSRQGRTGDLSFQTLVLEMLTHVNHLLISHYHMYFTRYINHPEICLS